MRRLLLVLAGLLVLAACAPLVPRPLPDVLILGEQHDAPEHQRLHAQVIRELAATHELAGVALEMADTGHSTAGLPTDATESQVRAALAWGDGGWDWADYAPAIMAAVRAGVPVAGANLPRDALKAAGNDPVIDAAVGPEVLLAQVEDVRAGHCGLLPDAQLLPLARIQVARDRALAAGVARLARPGKTAVLLTGARHADPSTGVPLHLPRSLRSMSRIWPAQPPREDYCAQLRQQWRR